MITEQNSPMPDSRNNPAVGDGRALWITAGLVVVLPLLVLVTYHRMRFAGLSSSDALDFAQIGRNLSVGRGFTTYILRPLAMTHGSDPTRQPDVMHGPLYPFLLALAFGALGAKDTVTSIVSGLFYLLTVPLVYRLGREMFGVAIARTSAVIFALNAFLLDYAASGMHISLFIFLCTWLFLTLFRLMRRNESPPGPASFARGPLLLSGALTGLLYLTDPVFVWILPVIGGVVLWIHPDRRWPAVLNFGLPLALLTLPWMLRNGLLAGNPLFGLRGAEAWMGTRVYPGAVGYRLLPGDLAPTGGLFQALLVKMFLGVNQILHTLPQMSSNWVLAFFLPSMLFRFKEEAIERLRRAAVVFFFAVCLGMLLFSVQIALLFSLFPLALIFSVAYLAHLVTQARLSSRGLALVYGLMSVATMYPLITDVAFTEVPRPLRLAASARLLKLRSHPADACISDQPWIVAWYADRPAIWIPAKEYRMGEIRNRIAGTRWVFLTEQARTYSATWEYLYNTLQSWSVDWKAARNADSRVPPRIVIDGDGQPLMEALNGFTSVEPADEMAANVVLARAQNPIDEKDAAPSDERVASGATETETASP